ncbi:MAG: hypothetical protein GY729_10260 [Desulfobacteraceae bacterium]|nr:hypothetical protein [Desulfobacteraceae bacterium]
MNRSCLFFHRIYHKFVQLLLLLSACALFLAGCSAAAPDEELSRMNTVAKSASITSFSQAASPALPQLDMGSTIERNVDTTDMTISLTLGKESFQSYYEAYQFEGQKDQTYNLTIKSYCYNNCAGAKKYNMLPLVYVFNKSETFKTMALTSYENQKGFKGLGFYFYILGQGKFTVPESGTFYILVAADNRISGKKLKKIHIPGTELFFPDGYSVKGYPMGEFDLVLKKAQGS